MDNAEQESSLNVRMAVGEASGDLLAGLLLKGMRHRWANFHAAGIGGQKMAAEGFECWESYDQLAIHGYVDAIKNYRSLSALRKNIASRIIAQKPDAFIGVDAPDFNLGLERLIKEQGIKTVHFVSPSVWAWRGWRVKTIAQSTDLILCLFPFEPEIYAKVGGSASYVGHPLADEIPIEIDQKAARIQLGLEHTDFDALIALMPGSRRSEINQLAQTFLDTARELLKHRPRLKFVLPMAPGMSAVLSSMVQQSGLSEHVITLDGQAGLALTACDVALIASGTATLEAALYKRPMVIAYKVGFLSGAIFKHMNYLPWIGLPNILCRETIVPERVQKEMNPPQLSKDVLNWLDSPQKVDMLKTRFTELHHTLRCNTAQAATHAIAEFIKR
ncbi:MAG: lipid-A-disaccharide synthase [Saezia sp.]